MKELIAFANSGRWVVECPKCKSAIAIKQFGCESTYPRFGCVDCGYGMAGSKWKKAQKALYYQVRVQIHQDLAKDMTLDYAMPSMPDVAAIEAVLLRRAHPAWQNWLPGMTVQELIEAEPFLHFSWTAPRTWVVNEVVTASIMNAHVRDNLLETAPAKVTTKGDLTPATGANALARLAVGADGKALVADSSQTPGMRWGSVAGGEPSLEVMFFDDFLTGLGTSGDCGDTNWIIDAGVGGSVADFAGSLHHPGQIQIIVTNVNDRRTVHKGITLDRIDLHAGESFALEMVVQLSGGLNDGSDECKILCGLMDMTVGEPTDGIYFRYDTVISTNWLRCTAKNGTRTQTSTGVAVAAGVWTRLRAELNLAGTSVEYFIDGASVGSNTVNIPTGGGVKTTPAFHILKTLGSVNARRLLVDYFHSRQTISR